MRNALGRDEGRDFLAGVRGQLVLAPVPHLVEAEDVGAAGALLWEEEERMRDETVEERRRQSQARGETKK